MDEDICNIAKDKRAAFIILPFHKQQCLDGEMEDINPAIRSVNENVLAHAPCSVGLLIDRRMPDSIEFPSRVAVLFFGGPDDREALAYAWRMSEHQNVSLKVVKFIPGKNVMQKDPMDFIGAVPGTVTVPIDSLTAGLADWCDCPELGPIGDLFATSEFSSSLSVLVIQQYIRREESRDGSDMFAGSVVEQELESLDWRPSNADSNPFESRHRCWSFTITMIVCRPLQVESVYHNHQDLDRLYHAYCL